MTYPQTVAIDVTKNIENIGKYGCLAMCYLYCAGIDNNADSYIQIVNDAIKEGLLDKECTVLNAEKYLNWVTGRKWKVEKKQFNDLKKINKPYPVRYTYNGKCHWVVVQNGKIVFNSLMNSVCVAKGKPANDKADPNTRTVEMVRG